MTIRPARPADAAALDDICVRTGDSGQDATDRYAEPHLLADVYLRPYLALEPHLAFVVADDDAPAPAGVAQVGAAQAGAAQAGRAPAGAAQAGEAPRSAGPGPTPTVGGYVVGARDTAEFERRCEQYWWPALRERYPVERWTARGGADATLVRHLHAPPRADPAVLAEHPSHLHVDLLPHWQGAGWGRRLLGTLWDALAADGSPGVHLVVARRNERAVAFYRRMGMSELTGDDGSLTFGRRLG